MVGGGNVCRVLVVDCEGGGLTIANEYRELYCIHCYCTGSDAFIVVKTSISTSFIRLEFVYNQLVFNSFIVLQ